MDNLAPIILIRSINSTENFYGLRNTHLLKAHECNYQIFQLLSGKKNNHLNKGQNFSNKKNFISQLYPIKKISQLKIPTETGKMKNAKINLFKGGSFEEIVFQQQELLYTLENKVIKKVTRLQIDKKIYQQILVEQTGQLDQKMKFEELLKLIKLKITESQQHQISERLLYQDNPGNLEQFLVAIFLAYPILTSSLNQQDSKNLQEGKPLTQKTFSTTIFAQNPAQKIWLRKQHALPKNQTFQNNRTKQQQIPNFIAAKCGHQSKYHPFLSRFSYGNKKNQPEYQVI